MDKLCVIRNAELNSALEKEYRQYLAGHLQHPQEHLQHIDDDIEIGVSYYKTFTADKPHIHPSCTEHSLVLQGCLRMRLLDGSREEYEFREGDFFILRPGVPYAAKNASDTRILFIKSPGVNDKVVVEMDEETKAWLSEWDV